MKYLLAVLLALIATPSAAWTCMRDLSVRPNSVPTREDNFRHSVRTAPNIVYGVVEQDIRADRPGILRVTRVHKGGLRAGQRLRMRYIQQQGCLRVRDELWRQPRGAQGVVLIDPPGADGIYLFRTFIIPEDVAWLTREGLIPAPRR
jgi:hypothetical protein